MLPQSASVGTLVSVLIVNPSGMNSARACVEHNNRAVASTDLIKSILYTTGFEQLSQTMVFNLQYAYQNKYS